MRVGALDLPLTNASHSLRACAFVVFKSVSSSRRDSVLIVVGAGSRRLIQRPVTPASPITENADNAVLPVLSCNVGRP